MLDLLLDWIPNEGARNKALHGSAAASEHEDIDRAIAFMSRALTTRLHRAAG